MLMVDYAGRNGSFNNCLVVHRSPTTISSTTLVALEPFPVPDSNLVGLGCPEQDSTSPCGSGPFDVCEVGDMAVGKPLCSRMTHGPY